MKKLVLFFLFSFLSFNTFGHARLKSGGLLIPRNNSAGLKSGPCGGVPRTNLSVELKAGDKITILWEETVQHPGYFEFAISEANDQNFTRLLVVPDTQDDRNDLPHQYAAEFTIPNITCENCTFQMIQVMTENPANPRNYYSCADIKIVSGVAPPAPMPPPVPIPPMPTPTPPGTPTPGEPSTSSGDHSGCEG